MPKYNQEKIYTTHEKFNFVVSIIALSVALTCFVKWLDANSILQMVLASVFALVFIALIKPYIEGRRVSIHKGKITLYCRPFRPKTFRVADTLYQIRTKDDAVRSFRFNVNGEQIQISPVAYIDGQEMSDRIMAIVSKSKASVKRVSV